MKKTKQTKFPVARIKKIMQTDEDVGKVAMATPVLVSKALELFMASLVGAAAEETRAANSKKMTPYHLKRTILNTPMFDFLLEQVAGVPDPVAAGPSAPKRAPAAARRKKAAAAAAAAGSSDDEDDEDDSSPEEGAGGKGKRPALPARRGSAKKAKVEIPPLPSSLPAGSSGLVPPPGGAAPPIPALPSVLAAVPPPLPAAGAAAGGAYGLPPPAGVYAPGLPPVPALPAVGAGGRAVGGAGGKDEWESGSEDGSSEGEEE